MVMACALVRYQKVGLEEVFLHLCQTDSATDDVGDVLNPNRFLEINLPKIKQMMDKGSLLLRILRIQHGGSKKLFATF